MICSTYVGCVHNCQMVHCSELWECFRLHFHKGWFTVSYAKGNNKGSIQTSFFLSFFLFGELEQLLFWPPHKYFRVMSLS